VEEWFEMASTKDLLKRFDDESDRISNLPSDTALESNKERQDEEMKSGLKKFGRAMLPGQLGVIAAEELTKPRASKSKVTSFKDEGDTASGLPREARGKPQIKEENPKFVKRFKKGGKVSSASARADGCAQRGKTKGRFV